MKCADPVLCYINSKGLKVYRHFSHATSIFKQMASVVLDCRKCIVCRKKRAYELASRCVLHSSLYMHNCFLTLTYDEKKDGYHNNFDYKDIQKFKKRLRQHCRRNHNGKRIEIFNVHEYGKNGKKHWHLVVFNYSPHEEESKDCRLHTRSNGISLYVSETLSRLWPHGFNTVGDISAASAMYAAQYVEKDFKNGNISNSKRSHSKHSGLGRAYFLQHYKQLLTLGYVPISGRKLPLPRYFQRLAHKHYCHFYDQSAFFDTTQRKRLYTPFKLGQENREIADLYIQYDKIKKDRIVELEKEWSEFIQLHLTEKTTPDFIKSADNTIYDLNKKQLGERF